MASTRSRGVVMALRAGAILAMVVVFAAVGCRRSPPTPSRTLAVCADPNNMPFSNQHGAGFENRIADLVAREIGATVRYTWFAQRRGFVRNTLRAGECDVIIGVPASLDLVRRTRPYYRSYYVFVSRTDRHLGVTSLDDAALRNLKVGVHIVGDDYASVPPAQALANRGLASNLVGYSIYGDYSQPDPPARLIEAVSHRDVDLAIAWGPLAGYFAQRQREPLDLVPVSPQIDLPFMPFVFDIAMGVRWEDEALGEELDKVIVRRAAEIDRILEDYGVPFVRRVRRTAAR